MAKDKATLIRDPTCRHAIKLLTLELLQVDIVVEDLRSDLRVLVGEDARVHQHLVGDVVVARLLLGNARIDGLSSVDHLFCLMTELVS